MTEPQQKYLRFKKFYAIFNVDKICSEKRIATKTFFQIEL
jgi:hypothetical protein